MKPPPFEYRRPETIEEALTLLAQHGDEAKVLAGGQSLVPAMNFRLAQPAVLVDLNRIELLAWIGQSDSGGLSIGSMTRQRQAEKSALLAACCPLAAEALPCVAHVQIRNRGTLGGSAVHNDPAAELPSVFLASMARFRLSSLRGERWVEAGDFFSGLFETAVEPDELLSEIEIPSMQADSACAFEEFARRHGDYALAGAAAVVNVDGQGRCRWARLVFLSVGEGPVETPKAQELLAGESLDDAAIQAAAETASQEVDPHSDIHASSRYRRHLVKVLAQRALRRARSRVLNRKDE